MLATDREREIYEATNGRTPPRDYVVRETIGIIAGAEALRDENDLHTVLNERLEAKLQEFRSLTIEGLSGRELREWGKWANTVDGTIADCRQIAAALARLAQRANLDQLKNVPMNSQDFAAFRLALGAFPA